MLSLQSSLREVRVVGPCWEKLKPKAPEGICEAETERCCRTSPAYVVSSKNLLDLKGVGEGGGEGGSSAAVTIKKRKEK